MKKKVLIAALFLVAYLGFLLVKLPASLVVRHLPLPPNLVQLEGVSGTLWSGQVARLHAILAGTGKHSLHALLDGSQAPGIEVHAVGIAAQSRHGIGQLGLDRLQE